MLLHETPEYNEVLKSLGLEKVTENGRVVEVRSVPWWRRWDQWVKQWLAASKT